MLVCLKVIEHWAIGPCVAMAVRSEALQRPPHGIKFPGLAFELCGADEPQRLYVGARSTAVVP